ncbi:hypothetical protein CLV30_107193 [Haloactinopolyspora alba]|uniref:Uncharacterized protein n=1 Tax=Haloactinopolyspora alba TaxID=648780 RepID=A0A2P8E2M0_9ACTN|nr:hypothetical protein [Haloactinopolyspora alba]PSL03712.1 hypothetical protein CLV30_107193 [Haloactinopolyspora alba]
MTDAAEPLEDRLRTVLEVTEAPPPHLVEAAKALLSWRDPDAQLAELVADSTAEPAAAVRAAEPPQLLTFASGDTTVVLEIGHERRSRRLIGQIIAPAAATVEVRHPGGVVTVDADGDGRFRAAPVSPGPLSVSCRFDDPQRAPIVTSWVTV